MVCVLCIIFVVYGYDVVVVLDGVVVIVIVV